MRTLVLYGSSRRNGNSDTLTNLIVKDLACTRIYLSDVQIKPIIDQRHSEAGFAPVVDDYDQITEAVLAHDLLVFGAPIYWYGMPAQMKLFFDRWSQNLRDKRYQFKASLAQKQAYVVLTGGDNPRVKGLPLIQQFQYIFGFVGMEFGGYIIGQGDRPQTILQDSRALAEAEALNRILREKSEKA